MSVKEHNDTTSVLEPVVEIPTAAIEQMTITPVYRDLKPKLADVAGMRHLIATFTITTDDIFGDVLFSDELTATKLYSYLYSNASMTYMNAFLFNKVRLCYDFELTSSWQHVGSMFLMYTPITAKMWRSVSGVDLTPQTGMVWPYAQAMQMPHQIITLGHNGNYRVCSDWITPANFATRSIVQGVPSGGVTTNGHDPYFNFGTVFMKMLTPLRQVTTLQPPTVRVWMTLDIELDGWDPTHGV